ncbi:ParB N-terminal domain-containing protein [Vibrio fluvialis]|nr:ParB N-terminal domain-containing protein [Vibrio fluvialis]
MEEWWKKRVKRSVDQLKLWDENPRLESSVDGHDNFKSLATSFVTDVNDLRKFKILANSIVDNGFIDYDPVVVWKNEKDQYVVAEGNRRVLVLKLLREPKKAPQIIKKFITALARKIDPESIAKIDVCVAPDYQSTIKYISQRHNRPETHDDWDRTQQHKFITDLYEEYDQDIIKVQELTGLPKKDINEAVRFAILRNYATDPIALSVLSDDEQERVKNKNIPITIIERWFTRALVQDKWGVSFSETNVTINSNLQSFLKAYGSFLKFVFNEDLSRETFDARMDTRYLNGDENFERVLNALPPVSFSNEGESLDLTPIHPSGDSDPEQPDAGDAPDTDDSPEAEPKDKEDQPKNLQPKPIKNDKYRRRVVASHRYSINVSSQKLNDVFYALKNLPVKNHECAAAVLLRVFLDLAVSEYQTETGMDKALAKEKQARYNDINLNTRLEFLEKTLSSDENSNIIKLIKKLRTPNNEHSLDTLNGYVHSHQTHLMNAPFICGFWDMLSPLFELLVEYKE